MQKTIDSKKSCHFYFIATVIHFLIFFRFHVSNSSNPQTYNHALSDARCVFDMAVSNPLHLVFISLPMDLAVVFGRNAAFPSFLLK
ncbi:hypothetical protein XELAEV_18033924mg [Xenopus laevis]|uniref:Uncharacterized protein n=1 Tax=Xenopus laevis TaxID=8355 RepID=A0A974CMD5_XENLA|nr:hypothetical protein XELAEV_18033924mg [Xenopus laevis]